MKRFIVFLCLLSAGVVFGGQSQKDCQDDPTNECTIDVPGTDTTPQPWSEPYTPAPTTQDPPPADTGGTDSGGTPVPETLNSEDCVEYLAELGDIVVFVVGGFDQPMGIQLPNYSYNHYLGTPSSGKCKGFWVQFENYTMDPRNSLPEKGVPPDDAKWRCNLVHTSSKPLITGTTIDYGYEVLACSNTYYE